MLKIPFSFQTRGLPASIRCLVICESLFCWSFHLQAQEPSASVDLPSQAIGDVSLQPPSTGTAPQEGHPSPDSPAGSEPPLAPVDPGVVEEIQARIDSLNESLKQSGSPGYSPKYVYVVDPRAQRMHILFAKDYQLACTLPVGTGSRGVGFESSQTPPGFYTMGGVRIAKDASSGIQTGSHLAGISGVFAELHFPPDHPDVATRGRIPINVVMHSYNPKASNMLRKRFESGLIGKVPCTMGCPVFNPQDAPIVAPYLEQSAGEFDPASKPGPALRELLRSGQVVEHSRKQLGDVIFVIDPRKLETAAIE